jgi:hypothetical protein
MKFFATCSVQGRPKNARQMKSNVKSMLIIANNSSWQNSSSYYCDTLRQLLENVRRLLPVVGRQKNWLLHHDNAPSQTSFFTRDFFTKNNKIVPHQPYFSAIEDKTEGRHFDTIEVIDAKSQAMLNTITEHDFQDAFKNVESAGNGAYTWKRTTSGMMVASRTKVSF